MSGEDDGEDERKGGRVVGGGELQEDGAVVVGMAVDVSTAVLVLVGVGDRLH